MEKLASALIGTWRSDPEDAAGAQTFGNVTLEFGVDGTLLYCVHGTDKDDIIRLTYTVEGDVIVTNQPSQPRLERTLYRFTLDGKLVLSFARQESQIYTCPLTGNWDCPRFQH